MSDYLCHYGVKGMKWGVINKKDNIEEREAENKRLNREKKLKEDAVKRYETDKKYQKMLNDLDPKAQAIKTIQESNSKLSKDFGTIAESTSKISGNLNNQLFNGVSNFSKHIGKEGTTTYGTYPDMSDEEIRKHIQRIQWERQYSDLVGDTKYKKSKSEKFREKLAIGQDIVQTTLGAAGLAATIASLIFQIKKS